MLKSARSSLSKVKVAKIFSFKSKKNNKPESNDQNHHDVEENPSNSHDQDQSLASASASTSASATTASSSVAITSDPSSIPKLFKLNTDCFDEIFDWLSQEDLDAMGQTCKVMRLVTGEYFQRNFRATAVVAGDDGLYVNNNSSALSSRILCRLNSFDKFIEKVSICENSLDIEDGLRMFCYVGTNCTKTIKHMQFMNVLLTHTELEWIEEILKTIETVSIEDCLIKRKFYEKFPEICVNLRSLSVKDSRWNKNVVQHGNMWLLREYPKLEHLSWSQSSRKDRKIDELKQFFQLNPKIRGFSTSFQSFWRNRDAITEANLRLDDLSIEFDDWTWRADNIERTYGQLNELFDRQAYKRLHLIAGYFNNDNFSRMTSLRGLYSLTLHEISDRYNLPTLNQLKDLKIRYINTDLDAMVMKFENIERIYLKFAESKHFLPFLYNCPRLKEMKIAVVNDRMDFNSVLDLILINKEREKLQNARKCTIFVDDNVFIATKWATATTEMKLVEIKRANEKEWDHHVEFT